MQGQGHVMVTGIIMHESDCTEQVPSSSIGGETENDNTNMTSEI